MSEPLSLFRHPFDVAVHPTLEPGQARDLGLLGIGRSGCPQKAACACTEAIHGQCRFTMFEARSSLLAEAPTTPFDDGQAVLAISSTR